MPACRLMVLLAAVGLGACATRSMPQSDQPQSVEHAVETPIRDLSLIREEAPPALVRAWTEPCRHATEDSCASLAAEIAELDKALGADVGDARKPGPALSPAGLATGGVESAVGLPFRSIVRTVTGAEQHDRILHAAVTAGMVRRGVLKGRQLVMACDQ